jgi:hypothetical protein
VKKVCSNALNLRIQNLSERTSSEARARTNHELYPEGLCLKVIAIPQHFVRASTAVHDREVVGLAALVIQAERGQAKHTLFSIVKGLILGGSFAP